MELQVRTLSLSITATLFWTALYFAVRLITKQHTSEYANRVVTLIHGFIVACYGCHECFADGWAYTNHNMATTDFQTTILLISLGYFIFDLGWCLYHQTETKLILAHHIYSCFAIYRLVLRGYDGNKSTCTLGGMEISNPLLQIRWFIRTHGFHKTKLFLIVEATFILVFLIVRIVFGTLIGIYVLFTSEHDWEFKGLAILIYMVSWLFTVNMYKYLKKKYMHFGEESDETNSNEDEDNERDKIE